jgi:hypothetical protein
MPELDEFIKLAWPVDTGTITVTTLTANRIVGTFSIRRSGGFGAATRTLQVRKGKFEVTF